MARLKVDHEGHPDSMISMLAMRLAGGVLFGAIVLAPEGTGATQQAHASPEVFGYLEEVMLDPERGFRFKAKLDTGADTSSLHAYNMRRIRRGEERFVRFHVEDPESGEIYELVREFVRYARIRRHNGQHQRRPVVLMEVCLGAVARAIEVNLVDRGQLSYPMLLGRSALGGVAVVDPQQSFTTEPVCWEIERERAQAARGAAIVRRPAPPVAGPVDADLLIKVPSSTGVPR